MVGTSVVKDLQISENTSGIPSVIWPQQKNTSSAKCFWFETRSNISLEVNNFSMTWANPLHTVWQVYDACLAFYVGDTSNSDAYHHSLVIIIPGLFPVAMDTSEACWKCQLAWGISEVHKREEDHRHMFQVVNGWQLICKTTAVQSSDTDFPLSWQTVCVTAWSKQVQLHHRERGGTYTCLLTWYLMELYISQHPVCFNTFINMKWIIV